MWAETREDRRIDGQTDRPTARETDDEIGRQGNRHEDRQTPRMITSTEIHKDTQTY